MNSRGTVILVLHNLGQSYNRIGEYSKAEIILKDVLNICVTIPGLDLFAANSKIV